MITPSARHASRLFRLSAIATVLALSGVPAIAQSGGDPEAYAPGRILLQPRAGLPEAALARILQENGGGKARRLGRSELRVVDLPAGREQAMVERLARNPHIKFAELDYRVAPALTPNDPYMGSAWHLSRIGVEAAWDVSTGTGVTVAILDSGVDSAHPDLAQRLVPGWNFYDNNADTSDVYGHGTQVAGSAGATLNNGLGVAAVSGHAAIMPIRVTDTSGAGWTSMIANGLIYAADRGVRVANISFANMPTRSSVVSAAQYMKDRGGLVFVAAGNRGVDEGFAVTTSMIPVSATDSADARASWSSFGNYVALSAPGVSVYTTNRGGGYGGASGTSIASPVAAGVAALTMAARPDLSAAQVESILFSSAVDLGAAGRDIHYGYGRVQASAAVAAAMKFTSAVDTAPPVVSISAPLGSSTVKGLVPVDVAATDNVGVKKVELSVNGAVVASDLSAPFAFSWDSTRVADGMASLVATAYDAAGNVARSSAVSVNVANAVAVDTVAPVAAIANPVDGSKVPATSVTVQGSATDDRGSAGLSLRLLIDGKQVATASGGTLSYKWNTRKVSTGTHQIQLVATDAAGNSTVRSVSVVR